MVIECGAYADPARPTHTTKNVGTREIAVETVREWPHNRAAVNRERRYDRPGD
jgi:hypothetical protein